MRALRKALHRDRHKVKENRLLIRQVRRRFQAAISIDDSVRRVPGRANDAIANLQVPDISAASDDLADETVARVKRVARIRIVEIEEESALRARADKRVRGAKKDLIWLQLRRIKSLQFDPARRCDDRALRVHKLHNLHSCVGSATFSLCIAVFAQFAAAERLFHTGGGDAGRDEALQEGEYQRDRQ